MSAVKKSLNLNNDAKTNDIIEGTYYKGKDAFKAKTANCKLK